MKNTSLLILLGILIILSGIVIAYKEEIKEISDTTEITIENYIIEKIKSLPEDQQADFEKFKELSIENKIQRSWELNSKEKQ